MTKIEMARCYGHMGHSGVLNNIITDIEKHYNNMVEVITKLEGNDITIAQLQDRVVKLEISERNRDFLNSTKDMDWIVKEKKLDDNFEAKERENKFWGDSQLDEVHKKLNEQLSIAKSNVDIANLDTKKEHALRLQLRDTKQQFKQLEEVHRKLKKYHGYLLVKHSNLAEENKKLKELLKGASNEEVNRLIDGTINLLRAWNPKEGSK